MRRIVLAYDDAGGQAMQKWFAVLVFAVLSWAFFLAQQHFSLLLDRNAAAMQTGDPVARDIADLWLAGP